MNFPSVDFIKGTTNLIKEVAKLKKYKAMSPALAILTAVFMLPLIALSVALAGLLYIFGFFFKTAMLPTDYLHHIVHQEGQTVKHATQFIVYFISWPTLFLCYAVVSATLSFLNVLYALFSCVLYLVSLGGFRFHVFLVDDLDISINVTGKYNILIPIIFISLAAIIYLLIPFAQTISYYFVDMSKESRKYFFENDFDYVLESMFNTFKAYLLGVSWKGMIFSVLYSAFCFVPFPRAKRNKLDK